MTCIYSNLVQIIGRQRFHILTQLVCADDR
uniref:Uncharacterized protein n=1 Tax=Arundo donax TaxID=35708 RepID=A0A0A9C7C4_ARUDO